MKKRMASLLLCLCMVLTLLPKTAFAAEGDAPPAGESVQTAPASAAEPLAPEEATVALADARVISPSFSVKLADANACRYYHGSNLSTFIASSLDVGRGTYDGGTVSVTESGSSAQFYFKERTHFKNADYLLQPFTMSVYVPAYTSYKLTFDVDVSQVRNAKGSTWCFLEMTDNTGGAAYGARYSGGENTTMYGNSYFRAYSNNSSYKRSTEVTVIFTNSTDKAAIVDKDLAFLVGNSKSTSLLTSYHHQLETTVTFSVTSIEPSEYVAIVGESSAGVGQMYKTLDEAVAAYNTFTEPTMALLRDCSTNSAISLTKNGIVNLNGCTLTLEGSAAGLTAGAGTTITMGNGTITAGSDRPRAAISGAGTFRLMALTINGAAQGVNTSGGLDLGSGVAFTGCDQDIYLKTGAAITLYNTLSGGSKLNVAVENIRAATYDKPVTIVSDWSGAMSYRAPADYLTVEGCRTLQVVNGDLVAKPYRLTFDANGGVAAVTTADSDLNGTVTGVPNPTRSKYTFAGWYTAKTGGTKVNLTTGANLTGDVTLYAHWTADPVTVTLDAQDGTLNGDSTFEATPGETYTDFPTPTRTNYIFQGWYTAPNGGGTKVEDGSPVTNTSAHTLYAFWKRDTVTVTFNANGGSPNSSRLLNKGEALGTLPEPVRTGHKFAGWYTAETGGTKAEANDTLTTDVTYYAHWTANTYTVTLDYGNGNTNGTMSVTYGGTYSGLADPTWDNYTFTGWYTAQIGGERVESGTEVTRTANHTLYARWSRDAYTITFDANGGAEVASRAVYVGEALGALPTTTRAGYTFEGWYSGETEIKADTVPTEAVTYTAKWEIITYTIPVNGGDKTITVEDTYSQILPADPEQDGYTFVEWQDEKGNKIAPNANPDPNNIPTAINPIWKANTYTVTFDKGEGTLEGNNSKDVTYGQPYGTLPVPDPPTGYYFMGWKLDGGATVTASTVVTTAQGHTLVAQYAETHSHNVAPNGAAVDFIPLTQNDINSASGNYELSAGSYYLAENITTGKVIRITDDVNLCFNGYTITSSVSSGFTAQLYVVAGKTFNTCDCQGGGGFKTAEGVGNGIWLLDLDKNSTANLYGGTFTAGSNTCVYCSTGATLTVDGASLLGTSTVISINNADITANIKSGEVRTTGTASSNYAISLRSTSVCNISGGTVTAENSEHAVCLYSGTPTVNVSGGYISGKESGIYFRVSGAKLTLSGSPVIEGGTASIWFPSGSTDKITVKNGLTGTYSIYTAGSITATNPFTFTNNASADYSSHFVAADRLTDVAVQDVKTSSSSNPHAVQLYLYHRHADGMEYTTALTENTTTLTTGHYFLTGDLWATTGLTIPAGATVDLCLNGYTLTGQINVYGTLNLRDCKTGGTVSYTSGSVIVGDADSVINYYGGTLSGGSDELVPLYTDGVVNLYAYPSITTSCDYDIRGNSEGFLYICNKLTKPTTSSAPLKVGFGDSVNINEKKQVTITTGWTEAMGSTADPANYFACPANRYAKVVKGDNGEAVLRLFQVTIDGQVCYPSYEDGTLSEKDLPTKPENPGYIWRGWYDKEEDGNKVELSTDTPVSGDITLYPRWAECDHSDNKNTVTKQDATCTEAGYEKFTCSECGATVETVVPALGHDFKTAWTADYNTHWHACEHEGCEARSDEGVHVGEPYTSSSLTSTPATCTEEGEVPYWCSVCKAITWNEKIPALGHDFTAWDHNETQHWHVCARTGCDVVEEASKEDHTFGGWVVTTLPEIGVEGVETQTCIYCGYSATRAVAALVAPTYTVTYVVDAYTNEPAPTQADAVEGDSITLPSGLTRTGYTLAGWALLDETGLPGDKALTGTYTMPARDVTFQIRWTRVENYELKDGDTVVLEDGTVVERKDDTVTIDRDGDGTPDTVITLPENTGPVPLQQGSDGEKDKIAIPEGTEVTTGDGPTVTLGGDGTVDMDGNVTAPEGSTVKDDSGNTVTITDGTGTVAPDGNITFPEGEDGKITVEDEKGNKNEITLPGGGDGVEMTPEGNVLINDEETGTVTIVSPDGSEITITLPDGEDGEDGPYIDEDETTGGLTVPKGTVITNEDGTKTTVDDGTGVVNPNGTITLPDGGKLTVEDENGKKTEVTVAPGGTVDPENPNPPTGGSSGGVSTYPPKIEQPDHGKITVSPTRPGRGGKVTVTVTPEDGYTVDGITVTDQNGKEVAATRNPDGTWTFVQPAGRVTISATLRGLSASCPRDESCPMAVFTDLDLSSWYHDGIHDCLERGLMVGTSEDTFAPGMTTSRAMIATILWRLSGSPAAGDAPGFDDVDEGTWYTEAVRWAAAEGVVKGYGDGTFGPADPITREQLALMLWRYAGSPAAEGGELAFTDGEQTSAWAWDAMLWATEEHVVNGYDGALNPGGDATRAEAAAMLARFRQSIEE